MHNVTLKIAVKRQPGVRQAQILKMISDDLPRALRIFGTVKGYEFVSVSGKLTPARKRVK